VTSVLVKKYQDTTAAASCLGEAYEGLVALLPFCYDTMHYIPFYECRQPELPTPPGKVGCVALNATNATNGTRFRTQVRGSCVCLPSISRTPPFRLCACVGGCSRPGICL
jgi:hypothetical protein